MFRAYVISLSIVFLIAMIFTYVAWELGRFTATVL